MRFKFIAIPVLLIILIALLLPTGIMPRSQVQAAGQPRPVVRFATRTDTTAPLRAMPEIPPKPAVLGEIFVKPLKLLPNRAGTSGPTGDPAVQDSAPAESVASTLANFEGVGNVNGVLPPDTVGDVGPNHYVQMVNLSYAIFDKNGNKLHGPANNSTLWQGFGGPCETTNDGDPIVLYDELADRWMMSQFALPSFPRGPFYQCIAISQSGDPLGAWHRYEFQISSDKLNDYPKFGVWPDGYYMSINQFKCRIVGCNWAGQGVVAFERDAMLSGGPARMVYFDLYNVDSNLGGMLPADLDGAAPPAGSPNIFSQVDDNAWGYSGDQLQIWEFLVDWSSPANSTFTHRADLPVASFDSNMCGYSRNCIPQPGGSNVDAISDRLMYRLQYRNFGSHQTLVTNHTVDANGNDRAGIRWYELRNMGGGWSIYQQGTFSPDSVHRWMGSTAMNSAGDIALGYSVSSTSVYPSIRFTGRLDGDALSQMTQGEGTIINGNGYQQHTSGRWGDYSSMNVDPVDDCTFWYTQEYYASPSSAGWRTRVGSFRLRDCATSNDPTPTPTPTATATFNVTPTNTPAATATFTPTATNTPTPTFTPTPGSSTTMHVGDLDGVSTNQGNTWTAAVTITVHDANHIAVSGVTVSGSWSGGASGSPVCTTGSNGQCAVSVAGVHKRNGSVTFSVVNLSNGLTYDSAANHDSDGDSDGTTITVSKP
jgi:hypothetical protein